MATKKQKREAALAKHEKWVEEQKLSGLNALKEHRENEKTKLRDIQKPKHNKEHDWKTIDKNCIHCLDKLEASRRQQKARGEFKDG